MHNNIGEARRIYSLATGKKVNQADAAEMFGVSLSGYRKWEQGGGKLNGEILCDIADAFGCSVDYLLTALRTRDRTRDTRSMHTRTQDRQRSTAITSRSGRRGRRHCIESRVGWAEMGPTVSKKTGPNVWAIKPAWMPDVNDGEGMS